MIYSQLWLGKNLIYKYIYKLNSNNYRVASTTAEGAGEDAEEGFAIVVVEEEGEKGFFGAASIVMVRSGEGC